MKTRFLFLLLLTYNFIFAQVWVNKPITPLVGTKYTGDIISAPIKNVIWVTANDTTSYFNPSVGVYRSIDGGNTWDAHTVVSTPSSYRTCDIYAFNKDTTFVLLADFSNLGGGLYKTVDGGVTWSRTPNIFNDPSSFPDGITFFDSQNGITFGDPINGKYEIYTTSDGGFTWLAVPAANCPAPLSSSEYGATDAIAAFGSTVYCGTNNGRILKSTDKGLTWNTKTVNITNWAWSEDFALRNENELMVFGGIDFPNNGYAKSIDGGDTWTLLNGTFGTPIQGVRNGDIAFIKGSTNTYMVLGQLDTPGTLVTTDGGDTWTKLENMATANDAEFLDLQTGYVTSSWFTGVRLPSVIVWAGGAVANQVPIVYENLAISPNPTKDVVHFETHLVKRVPVTVRLTDVMGNIIFEERYSNYTGKFLKTFYLSDLPAGMYLISAQMGTELITEKIVKQ